MIMHLLKSEMNKLISSHALSYTYCLFTRITGEAKPSEQKSPEFDLPVSMISVDESNKEESNSFSLSRERYKLLTVPKIKISVDA